MTIPLWLPWVILLVLVGGVVLRPESSLRTSGPVAVVLAVAVWLSVDHHWVTQHELFEATDDAADMVDGSFGGVTQDRLRIEIEDRLGRPVRLEHDSLESRSADEVAYAYLVTTGDGDGGPTVCVEVVELPVGASANGLRVASTSTETGTCTGTDE